MMKYFVLIVTYANGKKGAFLTDKLDLPSALLEFRSAQIKDMKEVLDDKSSVTPPEIAAAEIVRLTNFT